MKKVLSFVLVLAMVLGSFAPVLAAPADDAVAKLSEMGIVEGYADGTFGLENNITRAEFAATVVRMMGLDELAKNSVYASGQFADVAADAWYAGYVNVAAGKGIITGYEDGTFGPQKEVTYAEAATMIVRYLNEEVEGNVWPANYLAKATELGVLKNAQGNVVEPATRGTVFTMAYNALQAGESNRPQVTQVKGLVIENDRVENLDSKGDVVIKVMEDYTAEDMAFDDDDTFNEIEAGKEFTYTVKSNEDVEYLLGKVVYLGFTGDKVTSVEVSDEYKYLTGELDEIKSSRNDASIELDGEEYTVKKDTRYNDEEDRLFRTYIDNEDSIFADLEDEMDEGILDDGYAYARVTVKNGRVLFIDAMNIKDIAPVSEVQKDGDVYYFDDQRDGDARKLDEDDYEMFIEIKDGELYRIAKTDVERDDVLHMTEDTVIVRKDTKVEGEYNKTRTKKVKGDDEIHIFLSDGNSYEVEAGSNYKKVTNNAVYSTTGVDKDFDQLTNDYDDELEDFDERDVEMLLDMNDNVQLIRSDFEDPRFFGLLDDILDSRAKVLRAGEEDADIYKFEFGTDIYTYHYEANIDEDADDEDKFQEIYEDSDDYDENEDIKERAIKQLENKKEELVLVQTKDDSDELETFVVFDFNDDAFVKGDLDDEYFKTEEGNKVLVNKDTLIVYDGEIMTPKEFEEDYEKEVEAAVVIVEDDDDLAAVVYVKDADKDEEDLDTMKARVQHIDLKGSDRSIEVKTDDGTKYVLEADDELEDELDKQGYDDVEEKISKLAAKDQVIEITHFERDEDEDIKYILDFKVLIDEDYDKEVYRVVDTESDRELVLGFGKNNLDTDEDDFDKDEKQELIVLRDAAVFGDVAVGELVKVHVDEDGDIDAVVLVDEEDDDVEELADEAPVAKDEDVDTDDLEEKIEDAKELDEDDYTAESWAKFEEALDEAKDVLDDEKATQDEVDKALEELEEKMEALEEATGEDKEATVKVEVAAIASFVKVTVVKADLGEKFQIEGANDVKDFGETITTMVSEDTVKVELLDADEEVVGTVTVDVTEAGETDLEIQE